LAQEEPKAVTIVGGIGSAQMCGWQPGKKGQDDAKISALSGCYLKGERPAPAIDNSVDFGRATATRTPDCLFLRPPFPPAAERWAFAVVLSTMWTSSGIVVTKALNSFRQRPRADHR
jgi:hypothetical protein